MSKNLKIVILAENRVQKRGLIAEHGLSLYIEYGAKKYLFDTGQGLVLSHNAKKLDIDLEQISAVILSHGHDDHTGGLSKILELNPEVEVIAHKNAFISKFKKSDNKLEFRGNKTKLKNIKNFKNVQNQKVVEDGMWVTGEIQTKEKEYINNKYIQTGEEGKKVDDFSDDISLYFETEKGLVILLGCSHKGVINIVEHIRQKSTRKKIRAILGGMHLENKSNEEVEEIINYFAKLNLDLLVPIHCTGRRAAMMMKDKFTNKVKIASVGDSFTFNKKINFEKQK